MGEAVFWAFIASSTLFLGAALAVWLHPSSTTTGLVMAFGAGALISAASFELVLDAVDSLGGLSITAWLALGGVVFFVGDKVITRGGAGSRKRSTGEQAGTSPLSIVLGAALDGVPESLVLALSVILGGTVNASFLVATAVSNLPEAMSATVGLQRAGWTTRRLFELWAIVVGVSTAAAVVGYATFDSLPEATGARVQAFAAGAVITMLADTMMPEAYEESGKLVGLVTLAGFVVALAFSELT